MRGWRAERSPPAEHRRSADHRQFDAHRRQSGDLRLSADHPLARPTADRFWCWLCAVAAAGAVLVWALGPQFLDPTLLDWQPGRAASQPWRAISAAWVHLSLLHLGANLLGSAVLATLGTVAGCGKRATLAWALAWPLTHWALLLQPALAHYGGLSGVLHAGVAVAAVQVLRHDHGARRWVGAALLAGLALKCTLEAPWAGPLRTVPGWDIPIASLAHASGSVAGLFCALALSLGCPARHRQAA